jgi:hypothetical protein
MKWIILLATLACAPLHPRVVDVGAFSLDDEILRTWAKGGKKALRCEFKYDRFIYRDVTCWPEKAVKEGDAL